MMEDQLKNIKSAIKEHTFKDFQFDSTQRQAVFRKLKESEIIASPNVSKHQNRFRGLLTILAYCGMLTLITTILVEYIDGPTKTQPGQGVVVDNPDENIDKKDVLKNNEYINDIYPFKLSIPEIWINKVKFEKTDFGVRFFMEGLDGNKQDIVTIYVDTVADRLKFLHEGGPDPSREFAFLDDHVYRYFLPLDMSLTLEEDLKDFEKLSAEIPSIIQSFSFTNNKSGMIGETPYIYGFTPQYNEKFGFEVNTPNKWGNLFKIEETDKEMKFLFQKDGVESTEFLSFLFLTTQEWEEIKASNNQEMVYTEITKMDDVVFVAATVVNNPFEDPQFFYPFDMLVREAKYVIESFQFLD
jgi:hypothetical protein